MNRIALYAQDHGDPSDSAEHQMERLLESTDGETVVREYQDYRNTALHRMIGEAAQENPPFDEILVTDLALLGDTPEEVQERTR